MWIATTRGFYSAVQHRDNHDDLMVRARSKADLEHLLDLAGRLCLPTFDIVKTLDQADYPYRAVIERDTWTLLLAGLTEEVDYDNFKSAVEKVAGNHTRAGTYMKVWTAMRDIEHEPDAGVYKPMAEQGCDFRYPDGRKCQRISEHTHQPDAGLFDFDPVGAFTRLVDLVAPPKRKGKRKGKGKKGR